MQGSIAQAGIHMGQCHCEARVRVVDTGAVRLIPANTVLRIGINISIPKPERSRFQVLQDAVEL